MSDEYYYHEPFPDDDDATDEEMAEQKQYELDLIKMSKTPAGRNVLRRILQYCRPLHTTFTGNSQGMFLEGQRNIGLRILSDLNMAEEDLGTNMLLKK